MDDVSQILAEPQTSQPAPISPVEQILSSTPEHTGSLSDAAQALNLPIHEGMLGDPQLNGEHLVGHVGLRDLLGGGLSDKIVRAADRADDPAMAGVAGLGAVEKAVNAHADGIDSHAKALFGETETKSDEPKPLEASAHKELLERLHNLANNPSALIDELTDATQALHAVAPQTAQSAQQTASRAVQFLASKAPVLPVGPFGEEHESSPTEISNFNRYLSVVEDPKIALQQVKDRTIVPETAETLQTVYPRLYDKMKQSVIANLSPSTPYQTKLALSEFLGAPLDESLVPERVASLQSTFAQQGPQASQGPQKAPRKTPRKLELADRTSLDHKNDA